MLDPWQRWIQFHELQLKSDPEEAPYIAIQDIYPRLIAEIDTGNAVKLINNDSAAIRFSKYQLFTKERVLVLLVQYSDMNITDPAFQNLQTGLLRTEEKLPGEGVAVSAHVAISLDPHDEVKILHHLLLEEIPGLGRSRISPFFKSEFKRISKGYFEFKDPENNRMRKYRPDAEIRGKPSKELENELEEGVTLQGIEVVELSPNKPEFDEEGFYSEESRHIRIIPVKNGDFSPRTIINKVLKKARDAGYDNIKVRYKRTHGKQKTTVMGADLGDLADVMITRDEQITADEVLSQCNEAIVPSIAKKMVKFIVALRPNGD